jgi:hypothetical protein
MKNVKIIVALVTGLFAFTSAQAGELTVTGSMHATYQSETNNTTGNPLGMNTDMVFAGSTELDNGTAVTWTMATDGVFAGESGADHSMKFATPSFGTFRIANAGDSANAVDDITPTAFEEANGAGSGSYKDFGAGMDGSMSVGYNMASIMGGPLSLDYTYYPKLDGKLNNEKGASGSQAGTFGSAQSANVKIDAAGVPGIGSTPLAALKLTIGYEHANSQSEKFTEKEGATIAANYAYGPMAFGYQLKKFNEQATVAGDDIYYIDNIYGIVFAVNDALKVSYNVIESDKNTQDRYVSSTGTAAVEQKTKAINAAYTIGGLTIGLQEAKTNNSGYVTGTDNDTRTLSIKTAF